MVVSLSCLRTRSTEPPATVLPEHMPPAEIDKINGPILPPSNIANQEADAAISDSDDEEMIEHDTEENSEYIQPPIASSMPSRILGDVFHEMDKLERTISVKHSLLKHFKIAFSDTMLVPDKRDKQNVLTYLAKKGLKWDQVRKSQPDWLWKHVRRYIPEKNLLHPILEEFFNAWGPAKCSFRKFPLFDEESWKKANCILHDVKRGWISDPPGIPLYTLLGYDQNGLAVYHCLRGTNSVEGGVHNPIWRNFASLNASVELADALIADFRHRHNLDVGVFHKTGAKYCGHYDPWLDHQIAELRSDISWSKKPVDNYGLQETDPLQFAQTDEKFGIVDIPPMLRVQNNFSGPEIITPDEEIENPGFQPSLSHVYPMKLHLSHLKGKQRDVYTYLAAAQQTRFAVTPVHKEAEYKLFHAAVSVGGTWFTPRGEPNFDAMSQWWSHKANGTTIFYKLREHLSTYYKTWTEHQHRLLSLVGSEKQRLPNTHRIKSTKHSATVLGAASRQHPGVQADEGPLITLSNVESIEAEEYSPDFGNMEGVQATSSVFPQEVFSAQIQQPSTAREPAKLVFSQMDISWSGPRRTKICALCKQAGCPGSGNRRLCMKPSIEVSDMIYPLLMQLTLPFLSRPSNFSFQPQ